MENTGALETREDTGKGVSGEVKRWLLEIDLAEKTEERWRKDVKEVLKIYRSEVFNEDEDQSRRETFNILWSNVEIKRPSLYNSTPRPDIRRRYRDADPVGKNVSELMERCAAYTMDCQDLDQTMIQAVNDMLLPGRAVTRVRYHPVMMDVDGAEPDKEGNIPQEVAYEQVGFEEVQWDEFHHGPGKIWDDVPWISFEHKLTKEQVQEKFPEFADHVKYDVSVDESKTKDMDESDASVFKRCQVHEIWDKDTREVLFLAPSYPDNFIGRESDPLELKDFWPIPRPLYSIESTTSLIPMPEYMMYETLAKELENVTNRIKRILNGLRLRGVYDSTIGEIEKLFDGQDNAFIPAEDVTRLIEMGGLDNAIWTLPIDTYAEVLGKLYEYRDRLMQQIYEITGISDILRGATNANETLGAQEIKANFGTQRLQRQQREVQRYARDLVRLVVELTSEKFSRETLSQMSGLNFPSMEEKQQAQMIIQSVQQQAQQAQQQMQMLPPEQQQQYAQFLEKKKQQAQSQLQQAQELLQKPSWEDLEEILHSDMLREFRVDIETDSTIQAELQQDQQNIIELVQAIPAYFQGMAPVIMSGAMPIDSAKSILMSAIRRFKMGREVEDALDNMQQPQAQGNPEEAQQQMAEKEKAMQQEMQQQKQLMTEQARMQQESMKVEYGKKEIDLEKKVVQLEKQAVDLQKQAASNELQGKEISVNYKSLEADRKVSDADSVEQTVTRQDLVIQQGEVMQATALALVEAINGLKQVAAELSGDRETEIIRDEHGKAVGSRTKAVRTLQ